jgi:thioredoxin 1
MKEILSPEDFKAIVEQDKPVLLDFYADWCGPCQTLIPTLNQLSNELGDDAIIAKVNVDKNPGLAQHFGVRSIPALFFVKKGEVKEKLMGVQQKATLAEKLNALKEVA